MPTGHPLLQYRGGRRLKKQERLVQATVVCHVYRVWRSLAARFSGENEVVGSNPTILIRSNGSTPLDRVGLGSIPALDAGVRGFESHCPDYG